MLDIVLITDFVCPYCFAAKEALEQTLLKYRLQKDSQITLYPMELTPPGGEQADPVHDTERRDRYRMLEDPCEEMGLQIKLPPNVSPRPLTRLAWEGWLYACEHDRGRLWSSCMYHAYFVDELDIGDREVLRHIASSILLDADDMERAWDEGRYTERLLALEKEARDRYQPKYVPTIYVNGERLKPRAYTLGEMESLLLPMAGLAVPGASMKDDEPGAACGVNGCN